DCHGIRRRWRHQPGLARRGAQVLLLRRECDPTDDHRHSRHHRRRHRRTAPTTPGRGAAPMSATIQLTPEEREALITRHTGYFRRDWLGTLKTALLFAVLLGLLGVGIAMLEVSPQKIWEGFGKLGHIVTIMMPPEYGTTERLMAWTKAMA